MTENFTFEKSEKDSSGEPTKEGGFVSYHQKTKDSKKGFTIKYGGFSVHGTGWYILAEAGGGLAWQLTGK